MAPSLPAHSSRSTPSEEEFPYAIGVVSEVMESNGSSSMASTCGSTLALMDAGVPMKRPVSGVAMGLIQEEGKHVILTDIQGLEDFLGDMDFKVTGTTEGITALQMDNKAKGLTTDILAEALQQAKRGRAFILDAMLEQVSSRVRSSPNSPRASSPSRSPSTRSATSSARAARSSAACEEETGATIEVHEDGNVFIASTDQGGEQAKKMIEDIVKVPEVGEEYEGEVVNIQSFGAFVSCPQQRRSAPHQPCGQRPRRQSRRRPVRGRHRQGRDRSTSTRRPARSDLDRLDKPDAPASSEAPKKERDNRPGRAGRRERSAQSHDNRRPRRRNHSNKE